MSLLVIFSLFFLTRVSLIFMRTLSSIRTTNTLISFFSCSYQIKNGKGKNANQKRGYYYVIHHDT